MNTAHSHVNLEFFVWTGKIIPRISAKTHPMGLNLRHTVHRKTFRVITIADALLRKH
jgi:hypothetical protein